MFEYNYEQLNLTSLATVVLVAGVLYFMLMLRVSKLKRDRLLREAIQKDAFQHHIAELITEVKEQKKAIDEVINDLLLIRYPDRDNADIPSARPAEKDS
jgi:hypothetical protein